MKSTIFMVTGSDVNCTAVFGFYPTRELAEARCQVLMDDADNFAYGDVKANENGFGTGIREIIVDAAGADTEIFFG